MPKRNQLVFKDTAVFRYISTQLWTLGVPTNEQLLNDGQILIKVDTVNRDHETGELRYTGLKSWIGVSQIIVIEEVEVSRDA